MDMDYLAESSFQLIYFGTILDPSSKLRIFHETKSHGTTLGLIRNPTEEVGH